MQPEENSSPKRDTEDTIIEEKTANGEVVRRYKREAYLGKGGFAKCFSVTDMGTQKVSAAKIVSKELLKKTKTKEKLISEIKIHKALAHRRVVGFERVFYDSSNVYILLELCNHRTLHELMKRRKRLTEQYAQYFMLQIIEGVQYLHSCKVIHRDLKLGNLMLTDDLQLKIGDFGLAAKLTTTAERRKTVCGTPNYLAPYMLEGKGHSFYVDAWSIGVILYALLYGRPPFETSEARKTYKRIKYCQYVFPEEVEVSSNARNFISKVLVADPSQRMTLEQMLNHPFLNSQKVPRSLPLSILKAEPNQSVLGMRVPSAVSNTRVLQSSNSNGDSHIETHHLIKDNRPYLLRQAVSLGKSPSSSPWINLKTTELVRTNENQMPVTLSNNFLSKPTSAMMKDRPSAKWTGAIFVKKWVDYSAKYGLGYLLSDETSGVYFNDNTKLTLDASCNNYNYVSGPPTQPSLTTFGSQVPSSERDLAKKQTLMQYFRKYLCTSEALGRGRSDQDGPCYVKEWIKNDDGILFRLSNKIIQVGFTDRSQILIDSQRMVVMFSIPGQPKVVANVKALETLNNPEFIRKMGCLKRMLSLMQSRTN